ncbi:EAL domain-containing protein [Erythrobacter sp. 3-20A1M]|uniref:putative bifunctional diguanylate cyclase/phosphodiesterase n=1 Tax=Erythrobacter sp. 3-20A1M TaxID=2653850 RepID=UPI001BFC1604|nr:EAL domain-containing protein [Erythrobacter sp. 3-20A1M]QWC55901.1 EAL domain-containing protein [Erythrobacter sp. 3-20A1M]
MSRLFERVRKRRRRQARRRDDELSNQARHLLVVSLYSQPISLAIGALNGLMAVGIAAWLIDRPLFNAIAVVFGAIAAARVAVAYFLSPDDVRNTTRHLERIYEIGAFSYALFYGIAAALTVHYRPGDAVMTLMVANALCYGIGICARNAGRPYIALGQLGLTFVPVIIACLLDGSHALVVLALTMIMVGPAMGSITMTVFNTLRDSVAAAQTSERLARKMESLALTDVVTGLANRAGLNQSLVKSLMRVPADRQLALFWLDLDRFKEVNDLLGHQIGDRVLEEVANRLRSAMPATATLARFGGDEFVLFCEVDDRGAAEYLANQLLEQFLAPMRFDGDRLEINTSIGVALLPEDAGEPEALMKAADLALYHAKIEGRDRARFFDAAMTRDLARKRELEEELRGAIQRDELSVFFQPVVDLATGRIRCFEALVRWFHPQKGELSPGEFIPVAEETGLIVTLGNWITREAAKTAAHWPDDVRVAVNLSPLQIKAPGAALGIQAALRDAGLAPERLELEVTESLFVEDSAGTDGFIHELSALGVRFAMDDFGTGYSSLGYINKYPFSKIKVDRSFVSGPQAGRKAEAIIRAVAEMGAQLNLEIVAEGIETLDQARATARAGCTLGQGYYFSRAVPDYLASMLLARERDDFGPADEPAEVTENPTERRLG